MVQLFFYIHVSSNFFIRDQGTCYLHAWSSWLFQTDPVSTLLPFNHVAYEYSVKLHTYTLWLLHKSPTINKTYLMLSYLILTATILSSVREITQITKCQARIILESCRKWSIRTCICCWLFYYLLFSRWFVVYNCPVITL
jgi:hypothetical protein